MSIAVLLKAMHVSESVVQYISLKFILLLEKWKFSAGMLYKWEMNLGLSWTIELIFALKEIDCKNDR